MKHFVTFSFLIFAFSQNLYAHGTHDEESRYKGPVAKKAYIISPQDGATVPSTFKVIFGLKGMEVSPAGVEKANSGHHHLLIDSKKLPDMSKPLGDSVMHFGKGQTDTTLTLSPGKHTLQLILGDHLHVPHSPAVVSKKITVTVE